MGFWAILGGTGRNWEAQKGSGSGLETTGRGLWEHGELLGSIWGGLGALRLPRPPPAVLPVHTSAILVDLDGPVVHLGHGLHLDVVAVARALALAVDVGGEVLGHVVGEVIGVLHLGGGGGQEMHGRPPQGAPRRPPVTTSKFQ